MSSVFVSVKNACLESTQLLPQMPPRSASFHFHQVLRPALKDEVAAIFAAVRPQVNDPCQQKIHGYAALA